jgi:hypothetical protein
MRSVQYRKSVMGELGVERTVDAVTSPAMPPETPIGRVGKRTITLGELLAVFGPVPTDAAWQAIKPSRSAQMLRSAALAGEADALGIVGDKERRKIRIGEAFYLAADEAVRTFGPRSLGVKTAAADFDLFRQVAYYVNLRAFEKVFDAESRRIPGYDTLRTDKDFLAGLRWTVRLAYTPEQPAYF